MKITNIKKLINEENKTTIIGLLTILIILWSVLYLIPEIFLSLFNTILGNIILIIILLLVSMYDIMYGIVLLLTLLIIYRYSHLIQVRKKEGFQWSPESKKNFLLIQNTLNRGTVFDIELISKNQASQDEVDFFNANGVWPWSPEVTKLYVEAIERNPYIRTYTGDAVIQARKIYNQAAILRVIFQQSREGQFLINGVQIKNKNGNKNEDLPSGFGKFGYNSGLIGHLENDVIKCKSDNSGLERISYTGKGGIFGQQTKKITNVSNNDLENLIPGFNFLNGPCNPCVALNEEADYSCKFKI
jgi:hypothetical protein